MLSPPTGRREKVPVRLAQVDADLRALVAQRLIRNWKLRGVDAIAMDLAAQAPVENPELHVPPDKAYRVLVERRLPPGQTPKFAK